MPAFNPDPNHVYDEGSHAASILKAREDLETDYGSHVVVWSNDVHPGLEIDGIVPPHGKEKVVEGRFEIKATTPLVNTYGYRYIVFSEGKFRYTHNKGDTWITYTSPAVVDGNNYVFASKLTADWMGRLRDSGGDLPLSALTLPGTHNTVAQVGKAGWVPVLKQMAECQQYNLVEQLHMGVRIVDFRLGFDFKLRHGEANLSAGRLHDALDAINNYLNSHPGETVLVGAKWDMEEITGYRYPDPPNLRQDIENLFFSYSNALDITTSSPMLSGTRGKMLLHADGDKSRGISCGGPGFEANIPGDLSKEEYKWRKVEQNLRFNLDHKEIVNHEWYHVGMNAFFFKNLLLGILGARLTPNQFAQYINPRVSNWVRDNCGGGGRHRLGRVEMDFATPEIVLKLVETNF